MSEVDDMTDVERECLEIAEKIFDNTQQLSDLVIAHPKSPIGRLARGEGPLATAKKKRKRT